MGIVSSTNPHRVSCRIPDATSDLHPIPYPSLQSFRCMRIRGIRGQPRDRQFTDIPSGPVRHSRNRPGGDGLFDERSHAEEPAARKDAGALGSALDPLMSGSGSIGVAVISDIALMRVAFGSAVSLRAAGKIENRGQKIGVRTKYLQESGGLEILRPDPCCSVLNASLPWWLSR